MIGVECYVSAHLVLSPFLRAFTEIVNNMWRKGRRQTELNKTADSSFRNEQ
jgi:hypothetical protein